MPALTKNAEKLPVRLSNRNAEFQRFQVYFVPLNNSYKLYTTLNKDE